MHAWEQIQKTVDYIEEHLSGEIKIEDLAKLASLSQFYYRRLFSRLVRRPVNEYIRLRRLAKAAETLSDKDLRILDIALDAGFSYHETFTRAFKDAFGMTPEEYRTHPVALNHVNKPQLALNYTLVDENVPLVTEGIVLEITRRQLQSPQGFIGLTAEMPLHQIPGAGEPGVDILGELWDTFHEKKPTISSLKPEGDELGVTYAGTKEGYIQYFAGGEARSDQPLENYVLWELPPGQYLICTFEAEDFEHLVMDALHKVHHYLFDIWLPNQKLRIKPFSAERYISHDLDTTCMEIWLLLDGKDAAE